MTTHPAETFKERSANARKASGTESRRLYKLRAAPPAVDWDQAIARLHEYLDDDMSVAHVSLQKDSPAPRG